MKVKGKRTSGAKGRMMFWVDAGAEARTYLPILTLP